MAKPAPIGDNAPMNDTRQNPASLIPLLLGLLLFGFGLGYLISQRLSAPEPPAPAAVPAGLNLVVLPSPRELPAFHLQRHDGRPFTVASLRGHWNVLFFGYTHCPDVCPLALQNLRYAWEKLHPDPASPARPRAWFVSVDPDRDTPDLLRQYVTYFNPDFVGVTGPADQIDTLTQALGILYGFEDKTEGSDDYTVNHSAQMVFVDPRGRMSAVLSPPYDGDDIVRALQFLANPDGQSSKPESHP